MLSQWLLKGLLTLVLALTPWTGDTAAAPDDSPDPREDSVSAPVETAPEPPRHSTDTPAPVDTPTPTPAPAPPPGTIDLWHC